MKIKAITGAKGFTYSDAPQRSPEWLAIRAPRIGASQLGDWMGKGVKGQYLAPHKVVEREIAFQKAFGVPMGKFINGAMQLGIDNEDFVADQYTMAYPETELQKVGCFYNENFVASPDRLAGKDGLVEIKWLFDTEWSKAVESGEPDTKHFLQMQGQLWATGRKWCDYVAGNGNTGRFIVIRVKRDEGTIKQIAEEVEAVGDIKPMETKNVHVFLGGVPESTKDTGENIWN